MTIPPPLTLHNIETADGNLERLRTLIEALQPPGVLTLVLVVHDDGCPSCTPARGDCTCERVDVELRAVEA